MFLGPFNVLCWKNTPKKATATSVFIEFSIRGFFHAKEARWTIAASNATVFLDLLFNVCRDASPKKMKFISKLIFSFFVFMLFVPTVLVTKLARSRDGANIFCILTGVYSCRWQQNRLSPQIIPHSSTCDASIDIERLLGGGTVLSIGICTKPNQPSTTSFNWILNGSHEAKVMKIQSECDVLLLSQSPTATPLYGIKSDISVLISRLTTRNTHRGSSTFISISLSPAVCHCAPLRAIAFFAF